MASLGAGDDPPREVEPIDERLRAIEQLMLGLRLDEPFALGTVNGPTGVVDGEALQRLAESDLLEQHADGSISLTQRGRLLGGAVTAALLS